MKSGLFLKSYRLTHKLTQKEMAHLLKITRVHYARLENNIGNPSVFMLEKICETIGVQIEDVFIESRKNDSLDADVREIFERILLMNSTERMQLLGVMRTLGGVINILLFNPLSEVFTNDCCRV